jgi:hypothetical protein
MKVAGQWVGLGLNDSSDEVRKIKAYMRKKFSYAVNLSDTTLFDQATAIAVAEMQRRYNAAGKLATGSYTPGIINVETKYVMGYAVRPVKPKPIVITVEGHMSNMWFGPCAFIGSQLEQEGLCHHQPVAYDRTSLPFNNKSGVDEVVRLLSQDRLGPNGDWPFPPDLDWYLLGFSQGAIITGKVWLDKLRPAKPRTLLAARRDHLQRAIAFGDPYREKDVCAEWVPDPPRPGTKGISDRLMDNTPPWWKVHSRHGDLYSENPDNEDGLNRTAIYKIAAENSWTGGPASILNRIGVDLLQDPVDGVYDIAKSIIGGIMFLGNMQPHGGYDLGPPTDYIRRGLRGEPQPKA